MAILDWFQMKFEELPYLKLSRVRITENEDFSGDNQKTAQAGRSGAPARIVELRNKIRIYTGEKIFHRGNKSGISFV